MTNTYNNTNHGEINITTDVLETIAAKAASEVDGVTKLHANLQSELSGFFGYDTRNKGVSLTRHDDGRIAIDVEVHIEYGYSVPAVALKIQENVKEQILFMTDLNIQEVNVHVISLEMDDESDDNKVEQDKEDA